MNGRKETSEAELHDAGAQPDEIAKRREGLMDKITEAETRRKAAADALAEPRPRCVTG